MLSVWLEPPSDRIQGDQVYRTLQPAAALAEAAGWEAWAGCWLDAQMQQAAACADILFLCQAIDADFLPLLAARRQAGLVSIVEINDNFLEPRVFSTGGQFYQDPGQQALVLQLAAAADGLQFSTPYLQHMFGSLNANHAVFANAVRDCPALPAVEQQRHPLLQKKLRLGWGGSAGHKPDLLWAMPALQALLATNANVVLCIMAPAEFAELFAWVDKERLDFRVSDTLPAYLQFVASLDIGFAPLRDTPFNRGRSDVKFLEYTCGHTVCVAQDAPAYSSSIAPQNAQPRGLLFRDLPELKDQLQALIDAPKLRQQLLRRAVDYVRAERLVPQDAQARLRFVTQLQAKRKHPGEINRHKQARAHSQQQLRHRIAPKSQDARQTNARFVHVPLHGASWQLYAGLVQQAHNSSGAAHFAEAQKRAPDSYLPKLYAAAHQAPSDASVALLRQAQALAPTSASVAHALGVALRGIGDEAAAAAAWQQGQAVVPQHAPLWHSHAQLLLQQQDVHGAKAALQCCVEHNAFYRPAAKMLAELLLQDADDKMAIEQAAALAQRNMRFGLGDWHDQWLCARAARAKGAWPDVRDALLQGLQSCANSSKQAQAAQAGQYSMLGMLAESAMHLGEPQQARAYLARARRLRAQI